MSWRIATSESVNTGLGCEGHFDFIVGRDGTARECVNESWGHRPIRVVYDTPEALTRFKRAWSRERSLRAVAFWHALADCMETPQ
jgi:hypothetical protein